MYVLPIHIPTYVEDGRYYTDVSWKQDLLLVRDWLAEAYGGLTLVTPSLPRSEADASVMQLDEIGRDDGIDVVASFDLRCRTRDYWRAQGKQWVADLQSTFDKAKVVHCSAGEAFRPMWYQAHQAAVKANIPTVLHGPDMDPHVTQTGVKGKLYCAMFDRMLRKTAGEADICFFKQGLVYDRYAQYAKRIESFCHSMHQEADVISVEQLRTRLKQLGPGRPLRAVYAGRFVARKGLNDAIAAVAKANKHGVPVEYHLYGSGPEQTILIAQAQSLGIADRVIFHGFVRYDNTFLSKLAEYDLLLFIPTEEDTPRMLYDTMAAGLPLVGSKIPFLEYRVDSDQMGRLVEIGDTEAAAVELGRLYQEPARLKSLSHAAREAGVRHSLEQWYKQRAEWTQEVIMPKQVSTMVAV